MRVLIYTHEFPPFRGGAGVYSRDLAVGLKSLDVEVHVATPAWRSTQEEALETAALDGLHLHYLSEPQTVPARARAFLTELQLSHRFDLTLVTERRAQEIAASMPSGTMRCAAVLHGTEVLDYFSGQHPGLAMEPRRMRAFYDAAPLCIAVSHATLALARRLMPGERPRMVAVQNGIDPDRLPPVRAEDAQALRQRYGSDAQIVLCLGRLDLDKGQDVLMRAFREVRRARPRARLLIGGDGPGRQDLLRLRSELGLEACVEFLGTIPPAALPAYFDLCDLFALTSRSENRWEGFGLAYLEAGYYGKAVLGGNEGGVPEAIADRQSGLLVPPRDIQAVAGALDTLLGDEPLRRRMGEHGRQRVLTHFNSSRMAKETLAHLETALRELPPRPRAPVKVVFALTSQGLDIFSAMTRVSVASLRATNPGLRIAIACDQKTDAAMRGARDPLPGEVDEWISVQAPDGTPGFMNRHVKTRLRELLDGRFLFLDSDTFVRGKLDDLLALDCDIAGARNHSRQPLAEQIWEHDATTLTAMNWRASDEIYINGGMLLYNDTEGAHRFAAEWHRRWLQSSGRDGYYRDQPALNAALTISAPRLAVVPDRFNAQFVPSPEVAFDAVIWHYYSSVHGGGLTVCDVLARRLLEGGRLDMDEIRRIVEASHPWTQDGVADLARQAADLRTDNAALRTENAALRAEIASLRDGVANLNQDLARLRGSWSWRITAPLRLVRALAKR